jgi:hypothetical protein
MSLPSEPWITLAESDLNDYLVAPQAAALTSAALAAGQADPWTNIMTDVVNEIRSAIRGNPRNLVSMTALSIPPDLKRTAMALIVERIQGRIPQVQLTEDQRKAADIARHVIERIQDGKVVITMPPDPLVPDDQQRGAPVAVVHADRRLFSRRKLRGL